MSLKKVRNQNEMQKNSLHSAIENTEIPVFYVSLTCVYAEKPEHCDREMPATVFTVFLKGGGERG